LLRRARVGGMGDAPVVAKDEIEGPVLKKTTPPAPAVAKPTGSADTRLRSRWSAVSGLSHGSLAVASLVLAFLIWQFLSTVVFNPFLIPPPLEVIRTAIPMLMSGEILGDVA